MPETAIIESPPLIVCATRGGEGSRAAQRAAIADARERGAKLEFLYVVDDSIIAGIDNVLRPALRQELLWVGRALLELAAKRGRLSGVSAEIVVLEGNLRDQIVAYLREKTVTAFYIGAPRGTSTNIFGDEEVEKFALTVERESETVVNVVRPEEK